MQRIPRLNHYVVLTMIVFVGFILRIIALGNPIWGDEAATWSFASVQPFSAMIEASAKDPTPPLYYIIQFFNLKLFGDSIVALRLPSLVFGVMSLPMLYLVIKQLKIQREDQYLIMSLAVFSPMLIYYSQEARAYSLFCFLSLATCYWFLRCLEDDRIIAIIGYSTCVTLVIFTHRYATFLIFAHFLYVLYQRKYRLIGKIAVFLTIPVLLFMITTIKNLNYGAAGSSITATTPYVLLNTLNAGVVEYDIYTFVNYQIISLFSTLIVIKFFISLLRNRRTSTTEQQSYNTLLIFSISIPIVIALIIGSPLFPKPQWLIRGLIFIFPLYYILLIISIRNRIIKFSIFSIIIALNVCSLYAYYHHYSRFPDVAGFKYLNEHATKDDVIVVYPWYRYELTHYYYRKDATILGYYDPTTWLIHQEGKSINQYDLIQQPPQRSGNVYIFNDYNEEIPALFPNNPVYMFREQQFQPVTHK